MNKQEGYFEALSKDRAESAKTLEKPSMRGVKNSVVEKYSDQAHFIYELLQNADDALATSAKFELHSNKLIFSHNGTKRFSVSNPETEDVDTDNGNLGDINAITSIANSNKTEASIGKFGVCFKAVFQYTQTPHIYDPDFRFKIEKFIIPVKIKDDFPDRKPEETLFVFPFDHSKRGAADAYSDISDKLRSLDYPLLFLSNLKDISFEISGIPGLYGKDVKEKHDFDSTTAEFVKLTQNNDKNHDESDENMLWLFSRDDGKKHTYSIGFFVNKEGCLIPKTYSAFCFFPTKEVTGLNFILHAPFLLTDSRETIRAGVQHNIDMISLLSELAADSLVFLKEIGQAKKVWIIDDNIFDVVPYDENNFTDVNSKKTISFKPFYTAIKEAFEGKTIIPSSGGYVATENAYWAFVPQIAELFSNEQLTILAKNETAKWVFSSFGRQDTQRKNEVLTNYIDSITTVWLDEKDILNGWSIKDGASYDGITPEFIELQPIEWLHRFYKWISETKGRTELIPTKQIFLNQDRKAAAAFDAKKQPILFLPTEGGSGYTSVNGALLQNENTFAFIKQLGISEPSLRDEIYNVILPQYKDGASIDTRLHFKKFFQYYQEKCSQSNVDSFLDLLRDKKFILCKSKNDEKQYRAIPGSLYLPFGMLQQWFLPKPSALFVCFDEYLDLVGKEKEDGLVKFFTALGVKKIPRILPCQLSWQEAHEIQNNWSYSSRGQSWTEKTIDGCKELIETVVKEHSLELSKFIWSQLLRFVEIGYFKDSYSWSKDSVMYGKYEYFYYNSQSESFESNEAKRLRTKPWLLNNDGEFVSVSELTIQTIHSQYNISSDEAKELLRLLGIKDEVAENVDVDTGISSYARELGLSEDEQRQALSEYAKRKKATESTVSADDDENKGVEDIPIIDPSVKRVVKEISKRAASAPKDRVPEYGTDDTSVDEDDYSKPAVDIGRKIEKVKEQAEREIKEIARLEDLKQQAQEAEEYSYGWFKALLELESLTSGESNANSREISISFAKVEREDGTSRTLILRHPSRYIPQSMEDLADIPLELYFTNQPMVKVAVEVINVKSYTLRAKLRKNVQIDGIDLSQIIEARIEAKNPVFLLEELRKAFIKLGDDNRYKDDFNMRDKLCENIEFVFGPPGTGKTTYIAKNVIFPMMKSAEDLKVLVLTPTNKSADVLVRRIMESMGTDQRYLEWLVRFGATNDETIEQSGVFRDKTFDIRIFPRNVTVTTIARFPYDYFLPDDNVRLHLSALKWDYIIIDEASMIPLINIVYPLYKKTPKKFIIAGDPFQIEPIITVYEWKNKNIYTMIKLNSFIEPTTVPYQYHVELLTTQYRSIPEIGEIFSHFAYGGILKHFRSTESQRPLPLEDFIDIKPLNIIKFPVSKFESIYRSKRLQGKTPYQVYSALFAFEFVKHLSSKIAQVKGAEKFRIGLIAPYRAQADLIDKLMTSVVLPKNIDVQIGTIHGFQGDECDIIIVLFNPPPTISTHKDMFLNKLNIVNVSISRSRDYLFILMPDDDTENVGNLSLIKKVERLFKEQSAWGEQLSPAIEESIFGSKTYLEDNSFSTSHQLVNIYGTPEKRYEVRSEENAIDVQIHEGT